MGSKKKIVVTEKHLPLVQIYSIVLSEAGYDTVTASSGEEGLELVRRHNPDLVTTSMRLNGVEGGGERPDRMDGFEYAMRLRNAGYSGLIVAVTAGFVEDYATRHGVPTSEISRYITKALQKGSPEDLVREINELLPQ